MPRRHLGPGMSEEKIKIGPKEVSAASNDRQGAPLPLPQASAVKNHQVNSHGKRHGDAHEMHQRNEEAAKQRQAQQRRGGIGEKGRVSRKKRRRDRDAPRAVPQRSAEEPQPRRQQGHDGEPRAQPQRSRQPINRHDRYRREQHRVQGEDHSQVMGQGKKNLIDPDGKRSVSRPRVPSSPNGQGVNGR